MKSRHSKVIAQTDRQAHTHTNTHTHTHTHTEREYENITFPRTRAVKTDKYHLEMKHTTESVQIEIYVEMPIFLHEISYFIVYCLSLN